MSGGNCGGSSNEATFYYCFSMHGLYCILFFLSARILAQYIYKCLCVFACVVRIPLLHYNSHLVHHIQDEMHKKVILVLTKCDLVPRECVNKWIRYLKVCETDFGSSTVNEKAVSSFHFPNCHNNLPCLIIQNLNPGIEVIVTSAPPNASASGDAARYQINQDRVFKQRRESKHVILSAVAKSCERMTMSNGRESTHSIREILLQDAEFHDLINAQGTIRINVRHYCLFSP